MRCRSSPGLRGATIALVVLVLAVCLGKVAAEHEYPPGTGTGSVPAVEADATPVEDVCSPLVEARSILASLQPPPHAHLEHKIGNSPLLPSNSFSPNWPDGLGFHHSEGPLATTLRLLPRLLTLLSPTTWLAYVSQIMGSHKVGGRAKVSKKRRERVERLLALMQDAEERGCEEVWEMRGRMRMNRRDIVGPPADEQFPPRGVRQDLPAAYEAYKRYLESTGDPEAQFFVGFFHATGLGGVQRDQGKATLYYTFSALQGYEPAQMAMGYRHWAGIGVKEDCLAALEFYESAAESTYAHFASGPPGGRTLPLSPSRLSDSFGGIYGPHASWASTGANAHRAAVKASSAVARGETEKEVLEYYQYHSDRDTHLYTVRLGRLFYLGSIYFHPGGISSGAEQVGEIPQSFAKAKEYFLRVARTLWPVDFEGGDASKVAGKRKMSKEMEESVREPAMVAAAFLGRMALRGEGGKPDHRRARMWYERAADLGDREALNGLGIIYRDGILVNVDKQKAYQYFQAAAGQDLAEAQVNLAKLHLDRNEINQAMQYLDAALRHGSPFEAFHLLANLHSNTARLPPASGGRPGMCGVAVAWYKLVSERGSWTHDFLGEADRAWARGEQDKALLGWWLAAEMGVEMAQNNVAFVLERGVEVPWVSDTERRSEEVMMWTRSAAQDNVDAMVKVGDYYYQGIGVAPESRYERAASYYQTAADTQSSAMAYWNLGWMYENGQGVPRDWHLAKRFYDLSYETNDEAYLPVLISLIELYLKSWWVDIRSGGTIPGLSLFDTEEEDAPTTWERLKSIFHPLPYYDDDDEAGLEREEGVEDFSGSGWVPDDLQGEEEDLFETVLILGLGALVMGLVWVRGRWGGVAQAQAEEAMRRRDGAQRENAGAGAGVRAAGVRGPEQREGEGEGDEERRQREREREAQAEGQADGLPVGWEPPIP